MAKPIYNGSRIETNFTWMHISRSLPGCGSEKDRFDEMSDEKLQTVRVERTRWSTQMGDGSMPPCARQDRMMPDATRYVCKAILHCSKFGSLAPLRRRWCMRFDVLFARPPAASSSWGNYVLASCSGGQTSRQNIHLHRLLQTMRLVILILIIIGCWAAMWWESHQLGWDYLYLSDVMDDEFTRC